MIHIDENTIERLKFDVSRYFPFYDMRVGEKDIAFFCNVREDTLDEDFDRLKENLSRYGVIPLIRREGGEYIIYVLRAKEKKEISIWINLALLISTLITTILTGSLLMSGKIAIWEGNALQDILKLDNLLDGFLQFSLPLLIILGVHEMAHYYTSRYHGVRASLPFFIPVPPVLNINIGTFGALISSRDPIPNRKALFDIGLSGPLAGFIAAIPISIYGLANSILIPLSEVKGEIALQSPLLFGIISKFVIHVPENYTLLLHPAAFAGWVGLLVTAVNLFPVGQLDGGHIARAVLGEKQRFAGWFSIFILMLTGWFFFAIFIALLIGVYHPPPLNDLTEVDGKRKALFILALVILILCFTPFPIYEI